MSSKEENTKTESEEQRSNEANDGFKSKLKLDYIETIIKVAQGFAIIAGIFFTYTAYDDKSKEDAAQTAKEFRRTFYEKQFQVYTEIADAASILATEDFNSVDYKEARKKFERLYFGRGRIIVDKQFLNRFVYFESILRDYESHAIEDGQRRLKLASLELAIDGAHSTVNIWLDSAERQKYKWAVENAAEYK